jgi:HEAT repeat protein
VPAKRPLEDALADLRRLREDAAAADSVRELKRILASMQAPAVAKAAAIAGEAGLSVLVPDLLGAFDQALLQPLKTDPGCVAKTAIVTALDRLEHDDAGVFKRGIRHVQMEPVFGGRVDTALDLRGACALALARMNDRGALVVLGDLLADPEAPVRVSAARALAVLGREEGVPLLRLKALLGDPEPRVVLECLAACLRIEPTSSLELAAAFLDRSEPGLAEAAALALGESRLPAALPVLRGWLGRTVDKELRRTGFLAIATLRREEAFDFLLEIVREGTEAAAREAIAALGAHRGDAALEERVRTAAASRDDVDLGGAIRRAMKTP